jgi:NADPH:quinone reductase-like Zn-dependent oxidoreductase
MKRAVARSFGRPADVIALEDFTPREPGPGEVRVDVRAAPINPADELLASGRHAFRPALPAPIGIEGAGVIAALGEGVTDLAVGQLVVLPPGGTWCEATVCRAADVYPVPAGLDPLQAAMLCVNAVTASCLVSSIRTLEPGSWLIQNAAASAVGKLVIRLARAKGLRTVNVVRRAEVAAELTSLGADAVLVGEDDLAARARDATKGAPITLALDAVAGESSARLAACLAPGGTLVVYGLLSSDVVVLPAASIVFERVLVRGFSRLGALAAMGREKARALVHELGEAALRGEIRSPVEATYPLSRVRDALEHAERGGRGGKILLTMGE